LRIYRFIDGRIEIAGKRMLDRTRHFALMTGEALFF